MICHYAGMKFGPLPQSIVNRMGLKMSLSALIAALVIVPVLAAELPPRYGLTPDANDNMFHPAETFRKDIDFMPRGFLIHGQPIFITSAEIQYPRIPRALWQDRLLRAKRAGYNTIQTYAYWNYHEPREGQWNFTGDHDLRAFLKLVQDMGMYAIVRIGPYINNEWDSGGLPVWLRFKPGVVLRKPNAPFQAAVDQWYNKIVPLVASEQITRGGPVIMIQLENEYYKNTGTSISNTYLAHLRDKALSLGMEVPYFFSGTNHGSDPIGFLPINTDKRQTPWFSTELWTGWLNAYGEDPVSTDLVTYVVWKVLALGGAGFTHYPFVGGTNFEHWGADDQASSYDFGAPVGQQGDLRPSYYALKRAAYFADSFSDILTNSQNSIPTNVTAEGNVRITERTSPKKGTLIFLTNPRKRPFIRTQLHMPDGMVLPQAGMISLAPGETVPFVFNQPLTGGLLLRAGTRPLAVVRSGHTTTIITYGNPGEPAELNFEQVSKTGKNAWRVAAFISGSDIQENTSQHGTETVRVLFMSTAAANRTWIVDVNNKPVVICGPDYIGPITGGGSNPLQIETEYRKDSPIPATVRMYGDGDAVNLVAATPSQHDTYTPPALTPWQRAPAFLEAVPDHDDSRWLHSINPKAMGADGDPGAYAWYRTHVSMPAAGNYALNFSDVGDWLAVFANGQFMGRTNNIMSRFRVPLPRGVLVSLQKGRNDIAILVEHAGRSKLYQQYVRFRDIDVKGIQGPVSLAQYPNTSQEITKWRWRMNDIAAVPASIAATADTRTSEWQDVETGEEMFKGRIGSAWFKTTLPLSHASGRKTLLFTTIADSATVYLNGKQLMTSKDSRHPFSVDLTSAWQADAPNELAVLVGNTHGGGGIFGSVTFTISYPAISRAITGWAMRGGMSLPPTAAWSAMNSTDRTGEPAFYQTHFDLPAEFWNGQRVALRVMTKGLSHGFIWLNNHNLGRYPEKADVSGIYLPECWLKKGKNTLIVLDNEGADPSAVQIAEETNASRYVVDYVHPSMAQ